MEAHHAPDIDPKTAPPHVMEMARSDLLFELGVRGSMQHFRARYHDVRLAMDIALVVRSKADILRLRKAIAVTRLRKKVVNAERRYPLIFRTMRETSHRKAGVVYGLSHAMCGRLARMFSRLAALAGTTEDACMSSVEAEARDG